ncbi:hypothetical protein TCON_1803 [Astathelohania contejeani]|uniref:Uncharacterized protein n=1 Tax=Astathelohania contejeani TaxID=164912 RepID=A0ABQ7HXU1_9MICR|nr:hypothetical protein TCON_1803 [Thelohania contejeani]
MEEIVKLKKITEENLQIISKLMKHKLEQGIVLTYKEKQMLYTYLTQHISESINPQSVINYIILLLEFPNPIYLNEIKLYLKKHDSKLYTQYAEMFINTRGCYEAFGIMEKKRIPEIPKPKIIELESIEPVFEIRKKKKRDTRMKREIRKKAQSQAFEKIQDVKKKDAEYKRMIEDTYKSINK